MGEKIVPCIIGDYKSREEMLRDMVRDNIMKGQLDPLKFTQLYDKIAVKYGKETTRELFAFMEDNELKRLYKEIKKMDRQQIENFLAKVYVQGYEDGTEDAEVTDFKIKLMQVLERTKGVGAKTTEKILQTVKEMEGEK